MEIEYVNCNLCGSNDATTLEQEEPLALVKCRRCGLIYVNPQPSKQELFKHYGQENYYAEWLGEQFQARKKMWQRRFRKIQTLKAPGRLLDVGCGSGIFLDEVKIHGWQVWGTEVSEFAVKHARDTFGIEVFKGELPDARFSDESFDVITIWHVLEHTKDPFNTLKEVRRILKSDGVVIIAVPNVHCYLYNIAYTLIKLRRPKLLYLDSKEIHLYHFHTGTLKRMLEKGGLSTVKFDVDRERILMRERIIDEVGWALYKITRVNISNTIEVCCKKIEN